MLCFCSELMTSIQMQLSMFAESENVGSNRLLETYCPADGAALLAQTLFECDVCAVPSWGR